jgi:hypothetical protein
MGSIYMGMCSFTMAAIFFIMTGEFHTLRSASSASRRSSGEGNVRSVESRDGTGHVDPRTDESLLLPVLRPSPGIQIIPSVLIADQCVDLNTFLTDNFNQFGLSPTALEPWIQMNDSTKAGAIFQYFVDCDQPRPPLFDVFGRPAEVLQQNHINFTDYRAKVVGSLTSSNQTIVLRPNVYSAFDALDVDVQGVVSSTGW